MSAFKYFTKTERPWVAQPVGEGLLPECSKKPSVKCRHEKDQRLLKVTHAATVDHDRQRQGTSGKGHA